MKLPIPIPSLKKKEKQKYILSLLLRDEKISAIITEEVDGQMRIVGQSEELLTTPLEKLSDDEWLNSLDRTISKAEETLPPDRETHDTVFGVKETWVEEKKIRKDYLLKLKKISEALDLSPIGFLVVNEAVSHLIQAEEGAPVSAILADIGTHAVTATLLRGGKILETQTLPIEDSLPATVDAALKHFTSVEVFPSRLILFPGNAATREQDAEDQLAQQFISHHWSKSLPFLHPPQISVLPAGFDGRAMVQGTASQMGFSVLNLIPNEAEIKTYDHEEGAEKEEKHAKAAEKEEKKTKKELAAEKAAEEATEKQTQDDAAPLEGASSEEFGFVMDEDVSKHPPVHDKEAAVHHETHEAAHHVQHHEESNIMPVDEEQDSHPGDAGKAGPLAAVTGLFAALPLAKLRSLKVKKLPLPRFAGGPPNLLLFIPIGIIVLIGVLYYLYTANLKAEVTIYLKPNNVSQTADVLFSTDAGNNFSDGVIEAKTVSVDLNGSTSGDVTGKKSIGNKAQGTVTIFNNDDSKRQLAAGTTIATDKGLKFTLDKDVSVASASGDIFTGTKPGTAQVSVTASDIGTDYNLPSGTKFNVSSGSDIAAKNDSAFSGGSKKDVTVVSKKDQDKLLSDLSKSLQDKALEELGKKTSGDEKLLPFLTQAAVTDKQFDHKIDQEAKTLKLTGTVSFEALVYSEKDITDYATVLLKNKYTDNLNLSDKGVSYTLKDEKQKSESSVASSITIEGGLVPKLDTTSLIDSIRGKSIKDAEDVLSHTPQVARSEVKLSPSLPFLSVLPKKEDKITLKTALDE